MAGDEKTYSCRLCGKGFASPVALQNHAKNEHFNVFSQGIPEKWVGSISDSVEPSPVPDGRSSPKKASLGEIKKAEHKREAVLSLMSPAPITSFASIDVSMIILKQEDDDIMPTVWSQKKKAVETVTATFNIISKKLNYNAFDKSNTVTPPKAHITKSHVIELIRNGSINSDLNVTNECKSTNLIKLQEIQNNEMKDRSENNFSDNKIQYECQYCMKRFTRNSSLTNHVKVHTNEKPFKCEICGRCFSGRANLTRHLRVHTERNSFKCHVCKKCYALGSSLTRHMRIHSDEKLKGQATTSPIARPATSVVAPGKQTHGSCWKVPRDVAERLADIIQTNNGA